MDEYDFIDISDKIENSHKKKCNQHDTVQTENTDQ